jgi:uncharacterized SAM-binding protein YcdF (DUF218 family)/glycosyltransferase involved in cell wall biosynthesis
MLRGQDIICISSIDWDFLWQQHQEIMSTLAAQGNRVLFVENTGVRSPRISDMPRILHRIRNWRRSFRGFRKERERLYVYSPLVLPFPYSRIAQWVNRRVLVSSIRSWMRSVGFHDPVIWTFLPTRVTIDIASAINHRLLIYYCTDNFSATSPEAAKVVGTEREVIRMSDLVFAMSQTMVDYCRRYNERVVQIPMGVNTALFEQIRDGNEDAPADLAGIPRPIIGYVGGVRRSIDKELVTRAAAARPDCSFVFVGPLQTDVADLASLANVRFLGAKSHEEIPKYVKAFDCCILPYVKDAYTDSISPAKLHEYLIMGKPVVSTNLAEVSAYRDGNGKAPVVFVADDHNGFIQLVDDALRSTGDAQSRIAAARGHGWDQKIERMSSLIAEHLTLKETQSAITWQARLRRYSEPYRSMKRQVATLLVSVFFLYAAVFYTPLAWNLARPLRIDQAPVPADAIVVFAGGVGESGQAGQGYEERVLKAVELFQQGLAPRIVFSSGYMHTVQEPRIMRALALSLGVPDDAILLETDARNTVENVVNVRAILDAHGCRSVLLVSSPYHMKRASLVYRKADPDRRVTYVPVSPSYFFTRRNESFGAKQLNWEQLNAWLHELGAIAYYRLTGKI